MQTFLRIATSGLLACAAAVALVLAKPQGADESDDPSRERRDDAWQSKFSYGPLRLRVSRVRDHVAE